MKNAVGNFEKIEHCLRPRLFFASPLKTHHDYVVKHRELVGASKAEQSSR